MDSVMLLLSMSVAILPKKLSFKKTIKIEQKAIHSTTRFSIHQDFPLQTFNF